MKRINVYLMLCSLLSMTWSCSDYGLSKSDAREKIEKVSEEEWLEEFAKVETFNPDDFDETSIIIDNKWNPMISGSEQIYEGIDIDEDGEEKAHTVMTAASDLTKVINGVRCLIIYERDYCEGKLEEQELAFFAQDKHGNVWHFGQYVEHYEDDGFFSGGRMWVAGTPKEAKAGIMMVADPKVGLPSWSVGWAPAPFNWADRSQVHEMGKKVSTKMKDYEDILMIRESSHEEQNAYQLKYYASGIGPVGVGWIGDDPNKETMDLVEVKKLEEAEMTKIREEVMAMERRAAGYGNLPVAIQINKKQIKKP